MGPRSVTGERSSSPGTSRRFGRAFFARPTERVARDLVGARLTVNDPRGSRTARLVETEAYVDRDPANHANLGPTRRNLAMFGPPGTLYVYHIHQVVCANLVTNPGEAVLLRAAEPLAGDGVNLTGPGRLCRGLGITIADNGEDAVAGSRVLVHAGRIATEGILTGRRIGIRRGTELLLRFALAGNPCVSRPRPGGSVRR